MSESVGELPSGGVHLVTVTCSAVPELAQPIRNFIADILVLYGDAELSESGRLVCSELYGNSARHVPGARTQVSVHRETDCSAFVIAVVDDHPALPQPRVETCASLEEDGRGLAMVAALSEQCGVQRDGVGKRVWSRITCR